MGQLEIYVSTDIETDGPIPGDFSMLSLASAAFQPDGSLLDTFSANLEPLPNASRHPKTMAFWQSEPEAWAQLQTNQREPGVAMAQYREWIAGLPGSPVFVAYPVGFDFTFVYWYLHHFTGDSPFSHSALDMKTMAMSILRRGYRDSSKKSWPKRWFSQERVHTHIALDDAIEQGLEFCHMLSEIKSA